VTARLWIKVCGLRTPDAVAAAVEAGADAVGFVFHEASPRNLGLAAAAQLAACVPRGVDKVAVFLHPSQALLDAAVAAVQPDWVQTDAEDLAALRLGPGQKVLPVFRTGAADAGQLRHSTLHHPRCLLESPRSGTGVRADWTAAAALAAQGCELVLAGGLDATNVGEAIATVDPFGVDVSSGVERDRGVKDAALIREFIHAAREARARPATAAGESAR
jgi:phosphoribosylanthranilate isomerase